MTDQSPKSSSHGGTPIAIAVSLSNGRRGNWNGSTEHTHGDPLLQNELRLSTGSSQITHQNKAGQSTFIGARYVAIGRGQNLQ
jgi:hypothetical protein